MVLSWGVRCYAAADVEVRWCRGKDVLLDQLAEWYLRVASLLKYLVWKGGCKFDEEVQR